LVYTFQDFKIPIQINPPRVEYRIQLELQEQLVCYFFSL